MSEQVEHALPDEDFSALMQNLSAAAPLLGGLLRPSPGSDNTGTDRCAQREALLCALKPYLSKDRCAAIDYLIRIARVGDAIKALK